MQSQQECKLVEPILLLVTYWFNLGKKTHHNHLWQHLLKSYMHLQTCVSVATAPGDIIAEQMLFSRRVDKSCALCTSELHSRIHINSRHNMKQSPHKHTSNTNRSQDSEYCVGPFHEYKNQKLAKHICGPVTMQGKPSLSETPQFDLRHMQENRGLGFLR